MSAMQVCTAFPRVDAILAVHAAALGADARAYRHHVYRVLNHTRALSAIEAPLPDSILIAAAFHDLGIWTDGTFDYLAPSVQRAKAYLTEHGLDALGSEVEALITQHHRIRPWAGAHEPTVEAFRRADWIDVSLGLLRFGLPRAWIHSVMEAFPNAGFHRRLMALSARQLLRTPWRPLPMVRW